MTTLTRRIGSDARPKEKFLCDHISEQCSPSFFTNIKLNTEVKMTRLPRLRHMNTQSKIKFDS